MSADTTAALFAAVQEWCETTYGVWPTAVTITLGGGQTATLPIIAQPATKRRAAKRRAQRPSKGHIKRVLAAVPGAGETPLTAKAIAGRAKIGYNRHLYRALQFLVSEGYIAETEGKYSKTDRE